MAKSNFLATKEAKRVYGNIPKDWRNPKKHDATSLWNAFHEYLEEAGATPWAKQDFIRGGDYAGQIVELKTTTPLSIEGFCVHANITHKTFLNYEKGNESDKRLAPPDDDLSQVCTRIREICWSQRYNGALVGAYNPALVAAHNGLKQQVDVKQDTTIVWNETKTYKKK